jgi:cytochrome c oxidase subunit 2
VSKRRKITVASVAGSLHIHAARAVVLFCGAVVTALAGPARPLLSPTNIFAPVSTPAQSILELSRFVLTVTAAIFIVVFSLLAYAVVKFRQRRARDGREPAQVYGSTQLELAWTVIPVLIVVVLFLTAARVIASIQHAAHPITAIEVTVIGHQFWWEYRYPSLRVVTANELHIPVSDPAHPTPTFLTLPPRIRITAFGCLVWLVKRTSSRITPTACGWIQSKVRRVARAMPRAVSAS